MNKEYRIVDDAADVPDSMKRVEEKTYTEHCETYSISDLRGQIAAIEQDIVAQQAAIVYSQAKKADIEAKINQVVELVKTKKAAAPVK